MPNVKNSQATVVQETQAYAKRQATWFRNQLPDWTWVAPDNALGEILRALGR